MLQCEKVKPSWRLLWIRRDDALYLQSIRQFDMLSQIISWAELAYARVTCTELKTRLFNLQASGTRSERLYKLLTMTNILSSFNPARQRVFDKTRTNNYGRRHWNAPVNISSGSTSHYCCHTRKKHLLVCLLWDNAQFKYWWQLLLLKNLFVIKLSLDRLVLHLKNWSFFLRLKHKL